MPSTGTIRIFRRPSSETSGAAPAPDAESPTRLSASGSAPEPKIALPTADSKPRMTIAGYRIYEESGLGPLGRIYRARKMSGEWETVSFLAFARPALTPDEEWHTAIRQFSDLLARFTSLPPHSSLQRTITFGEEDGMFWVAQEWLPRGMTLAEYIRRYGVQSVPWALAVLKQVAEGIDWLAKRDLCHSDLRPEHILLLRDDNAANSYSARAILLHPGVAQARTKYGSPFAAPEQMDPSGGRAHPSADIYGLGTLLYFILGGAPPFPGESASSVADAVGRDWPRPLPEKPPYLHAVLTALLAKDPRQRYARAMDAIEDLVAHRAPTAESLAMAAAWGKQGGAPVALQRYQISEQDAMAAREAAQDEAREVAVQRQLFRVTAGGWAVVAGVAALACGALAHAGSVPAANRSLSVAAVQGTPTVGKIGQATHGVRAGESLRATAGGMLVFATGKGQTLTLANRRVRLLLQEGSRLEVRETEYRNGSLLRVKLRQGSLTALALPRTRDDVFEVDAAGCRLLVDGGLVGVEVTGPKQATVAMAVEPDGGLRVVAGDTQKRMPAGKQMALSLVRRNTAGVTFVPEPTAVSPAMRGLLEKAGESLPAPGGVASALLAGEDRVLMPVLDFLGGLTNYTTRLADGRKQGEALDSMRGLCGLIESARAKDRSYPPSVDPATLGGLRAGEADRSTILPSFLRGRLSHYRRLPGGGYEVEARATDSRGTLVRARNGEAYLVGNDDTRRPDSP